MATPATTENLSLGNRDGVLANFTSLSDTDTWQTGLGVVEAVFIINTVSGVTYGATYSGGTVTFALSGDLTSPMILAIGYE